MELGFYSGAQFRQFVSEILLDINLGNINLSTVAYWVKYKFHLLNCSLLCFLCSQQQLRRCQSELNRQVKQSSSVIQEKVPFNDTSEYLALTHTDRDSLPQSQHVFEKTYVFVTDTLTTFCPGVNRVKLHQTLISHSWRQDTKAFKLCLSSQ